MDNPGSTAFAHHNQVIGNYIGTDSQGTAALPNLNGVSVAADLNFIGGPDFKLNVISGNLQDGVLVTNGKDNSILQNYIGLQSNGGLPLANGNNGVSIVGGRDTLVGSQAVICANKKFGVAVGAGVPGTRIRDDFIGVTKGGTKRPNEKGNIDVSKAGPGTEVVLNIISGSEGPSIFIEFTTDVEIADNTISDSGGSAIKFVGVTDSTVTGNTIANNGGHGIEVVDSSNNLIGGSLPYANLITANTLDGVSVVNTSGSAYANTILTNSIYANGGLGIDLGNNDVTPNDSLDPDDGPNHFQNFPVIESATYDPIMQALNILVTLNSTPDSLFTFELFLNDAADPSGYGEGQTPIPGGDFTTDANGNAAYGLVMMPFSPDPTGKWLTATATRWENDVMTDTSEFSQAVQVTAVGGEGGGGEPPGGGETFGMSSGDQVLAIGSDAGDWPLVQIADARTGRVRFGLVPYTTSFRGGVRTAVADVNGDGVPDIITAPGAGGSGEVQAFDGVSGNILHRFTPFPGFAGGLFVSAGDIDGDRQADLVVSMDSDGGDVAAFSGGTGAELRRFSAFAGFTGGVRIALGDVNGDGRSDILVYVSRLLGRQARNVNSSAAQTSSSYPASSRTNRRSTAASMSRLATSTAMAVPISSPAQAGAGPHRRTSSAATARCLRAFGHTAIHSRAESASRPAMSTATAASICC